MHETIPTIDRRTDKIIPEIKPVTIYIDEGMHNAMKAIAATNGMKLSTIYEAAIEEFLSRRNNPKSKKKA